MERPSATLSPREAYALLTGLVVPRPIAWITTKDGAHVNVAPFSYFNALASDPPMLTVSFARRRDGSPKDTLRLLQKTQALCVNLVEEHDLARMNATSAELLPDESEAERFGIATVPCVAIDGVRIASARAAFECRPVSVTPYGNRQKVDLVVVEVVHVYVDDAVVAADGSVDADAVAAVGRLGGTHYATLGRRLSLPRP